MPQDQLPAIIVIWKQRLPVNLREDNAVNICTGVTQSLLLVAPISWIENPPTLAVQFHGLEGRGITR